MIDNMNQGTSGIPAPPETKPHKKGPDSRTRSNTTVSRQHKDPESRQHKAPESGQHLDSEPRQHQDPGSGQQHSAQPGHQHDPERQKKRASRRAMRRRQVRRRLFLLILIAVILIVIAVYLIIRYTPTSKRMAYEDYFGTMKDNEAAIMLQDQLLTDQRAFVSEAGAVYLPYTLVREALNERFFWDEEQSQLLFTTATQTFEIPAGSASYRVIDGTLPDDPSQEASFSEKILLQGTGGEKNADSDASPGADSDGAEASGAENGSESADRLEEADAALYLSLSFLSQFTDIASVYNPDSRHVFIRTQWGSVLTANARKEAAVRYQGGIKSPIVADLFQGDQVCVLAQETNWMKVQTRDGIIGWVKSNRMEEPETTELKNEGFTPIEYPSISMEGKVALVWHMVSNQEDNKNLAAATEGMTGINVISPTWFSLADNEGNVDSRGSTAYVEEAHNMGLQVWGLVDDFSPDMDNSVMLASTRARRNCINQLIGYAKTLNLDGINIDFEHIDPGDRYTYTEFIREISISCRMNSLVLSVDTYPPYEFNAYLNRPEIAAVCDYLINMGYDEHYVGSETAGSVASIGYEEGAITNLLLMGVPANKLVSAIPFYTRIWYTSQDGDGNTYINSEELSMRAVNGTLKSWNLTPSWDPVTAQNYIGWYTDEGVLCEIWIEDADSLRRKSLLVSANGLAGCAIWALGFQDNSVWNVISDTLALPREEAVTLNEQLKAQDKQEMARSIEAQSSTESETALQPAG